MALEIGEVASKRDQKDFINLPWKIYSGDPHWVPPLKIAVKELLSPKHPFYKTAKGKHLIAREDHRIVGRISVLDNHRYNEYHHSNHAFFGFFEIDTTHPGHKNIAQQLLAKAEEIAKEMGRDKLVGPVNPSTNYECGLLIEDKEPGPPQLMMTYNPSSYAEILQDMGMTKAKDLLAYKMVNFQTLPEKIIRIAEMKKKRGKLTSRPVNLKDWDNEIQKMLEIYNSAWAKNWGFVPMTREEFSNMAKEMKPIVDANLINFAVADGREVGFIIALPDFNQVFKDIPNGKLLPTGLFKILTGKKKIDRARVITLGIHPEWQAKGLGSILYVALSQALKEAGQYKEVEASWILEDNLDMNKPLQLMGGEVYRRYRIYEKSL